MSILPSARALSSDEAESETMPFGHLAIRFDSRVLRPRPWTVAQSEWAGELLLSVPEGPVLEVCTGAGQIGLLALTGHQRDLVLVDLSEAACHYARINAAAAGLAGAVEVRHGRMDEVLAPQETFALVIADPPWVPSDGTATFPEDPLTAIDGGPDGMDVVVTCLEVIGGHLADGGEALLQLGTLQQATAVEVYVVEHPELRLTVVEHREHVGMGVVARLARI